MRDGFSLSKRHIIISDIAVSQVFLYLDLTFGNIKVNRKKKIDTNENKHIAFYKPRYSHYTFFLRSISKHIIWYDEFNKMYLRLKNCVKNVFIDVGVPNLMII